MELTQEQILKTEKILSFYNSKDKEIKKIGKILFTDFLDEIGLKHQFVRYRYIWYDFYRKISYSNWLIKNLKKISPNICFYLLTSDKKYLPIRCKLVGKYLTVNGQTQYDKSFFVKK